ncbi:MAG TPA: DUF3160 domain-containing protein [Armatimonadota bacterium]|nr:DUF3160 domain-containing protein [Armatimonadota bacterium]
MKQWWLAAVIGVAGVVSMSGRVGVTSAAIGAAGAGRAATARAAYQPVEVVAKLPAYTVAPDLSNVVNRAQFGEFAAPARRLLAANGFVCLPSDDVQLHHIYEQNDYLNLPSFITTDSVLQLYHIFFDYTLRTTETEKLYPVLEKLTTAMLEQSLATYREAKTPAVQEGALCNVAYFLVPARVLEMDLPTVPEEAQAMAQAELGLIGQHGGRVESPIFGCPVDYSQFIPRGHYTRTPRFERFFRAMMWYGLVPFVIPGPDADGKLVWAARTKRTTLQALLVVRDIVQAKHEGKPVRDLWETIYEPTAFYVGAADDLFADDVAPLMREVYGAQFELDALADESKLDQFARRTAKLRGPRIKQVILDMPGGMQYRFMGQRYIPDSEMLQRLTTWPERPMPLGLDVFAVLGSDRAAYLLDEVYKEPQQWDEYLPRRKQLREEFAALPEDTWRSNLYFGWVWSLQALLAEAPAGYPSFMRSTAWLDKSLNTSLASWAELRHDTILYAKQSYSECGDGEEPPPPPQGYVEPNPEFYNRMLELARLSREGLSRRGLLSENVQDKFGSLEEMLDFLRRVSLKELRGEELSREEYQDIVIYGATLENLTLSIAEGDILSETDKDMAVVADVHTSLGSCLEEGVGRVAKIYVVVPIAGKLHLTRGAAFTYYEFQWPASDRLTDEKWQQMLRGGEEPDPPVWVESFFTDESHKIPEPKGRTRYSSGC